MEFKKKIKDTVNKSVVARGRGKRVDKTGEANKKVQTSSYRINKSW